MARLLLTLALILSAPPLWATDFIAPRTAPATYSQLGARFQVDAGAVRLFVQQFD